jgi:hypothetical protein
VVQHLKKTCSYRSKNVVIRTMHFTCHLCLKRLSSSIGALGCGHCFHTQCIKDMVANGEAFSEPEGSSEFSAIAVDSDTENIHVRCPVCRRYDEPFTRLYLDLPPSSVFADESFLNDEDDDTENESESDNNVPHQGGEGKHGDRKRTRDDANDEDLKRLQRQVALLTFEQGRLERALEVAASSWVRGNDQMRHRIADLANQTNAREIELITRVMGIHEACIDGFERARLRSIQQIKIQREMEEQAKKRDRKSQDSCRIM